MATREEAEDALYGAIISNAKAAQEEPGAVATDALKTLAQAFSSVAHGPQGGEKLSIENYRGSTDYRYRSENHQRTDYHETRHQGQERDRPPTGFEAAS